MRPGATVGVVQPDGSYLSCSAYPDYLDGSVEHQGPINNGRQTTREFRSETVPLVLEFIPINGYYKG